MAKVFVKHDSDSGHMVVYTTLPSAITCSEAAALRERLTSNPDFFLTDDDYDYAYKRITEDDQPIDEDSIGQVQVSVSISAQMSDDALQRILTVFCDAVSPLVRIESVDMTGLHKRTHH